MPFKALKDTAHNSTTKTGDNLALMRKMQLHGARSSAQNSDSAVLTIHKVNQARLGRVELQG